MEQKLIPLYTPISEYFTLKQALWLPQWELAAYPENEIIFQNIIKLAEKMDHVSELLDKSTFVVHCWYRPKKYNEFIKSKAKNSPHIFGKACDGHFIDHDCDEVRNLLKDKLELIGIRMENNAGKNWLHFDTNEPINNNRFFNG